MSGTRTRAVAGYIVLALGSASLTIAALEIGLRALVSPSSSSTGRLLGSELPPVRLIPPVPPHPRPRQRPPGRIRRDDLSGVFREDATLGYAPRERAVSTNGWWQSNNLGARARHDTSAAVPPGTTRVLVFGDSFAAGSRVPQESAWASVLDASRPELEVVNLGVDGYSTGQSLLRYRALRDRLEHHLVVLTLSPRADFWRDVNTLRSLVGWRSYTIMPRFVLDDRGLRLVPGPYDPPGAIYDDNRTAPSARLREHLRRYDRFYVPWMHEPLPEPFDRSVLVRFALARWHQAILRRRHREALEPDSEAVAVTAGIVHAMRAEALARGAGFLVVFLPSERDLSSLRRSGAYRRRWEATVGAIARDGVACLDLAPALRAAPADRIDRGVDGTHHGPRTNALIAVAVGDALLPAARTADAGGCVAAPG